MKILPPKCPHCKERLEKVLEYSHIIYVFEPTSGTYKADDGELEMHCLNCDAKLYDIFPDGICSFKTEKKSANTGSNTRPTKNSRQTL